MIKIRNRFICIFSRYLIRTVSTTFVLVINSSLAIAGIEGSVHDLGDLNPTGQLCNVCHTPHSDNDVLPLLWNHELSTATYSLYASDTITVAPDQPGIGSITRMCLSCHDGTVAIDSFANNTGNDTNKMTGISNKGTDLSDDHPVSVAWGHQTQGYGALDRCTRCHYNFGDEIPTKIGNGLKFFNKRIECATCHDVHNQQVADIKLLRQPLAGSEICLTCHPK